MRIVLDLDDHRLEAALARLRVPQGEATDAGAKLASLSLRLYLEWLLDERRPDTVSQMLEHWVAGTEDTLFPEEPPNPTKLYERYNLPLPRARYVARLLTARSTGRWRVVARRELSDKLREGETDARAAEKERPEQNFDFVLTKAAMSPAPHTPAPSSAWWHPCGWT